MNLILIYGSPGVGKFTVAKELSKIIGYKLFHNHLTADLAKVLFDNGTPDFDRYRDKLRYEFIELACRKNVNFIFTICYAPTNKDDYFIKRTIQIVKKYRGKIYFIHLRAHKKEIEKRIKDNSRKYYSKIKHIKVLREVMKKYGEFPPIPFVESLKIDNTKIPPKKAAMMIMEYAK